MSVFVYKRWTINSEIENTKFEFRLTAREWDRLGLQKLAGIFLMKSYLMLKDARFYCI